jgi:polysaccharide biosynthesis protein PslJ
VSASPRLERLGVLRSPDALLISLGLIGGAALGALCAYRLQYGLAALAAAVLAVATIRRPANLAVLAVLGVFAVQRLGNTRLGATSQGGVSYSDVLLTGALLLAIPAVFGTATIGRLRTALVGVAIYLACLVPSVILHPSTRAYFEWTHRLVLVGGAVIVGAWIAREGLTRLALRGLATVACVVSAAAIEFAISSGFDPASPFGLHKNFVGALFAAVIIVVAVAPQAIELSTRQQAFVLVVLATGLVASQSRGAMLSAVGGLLLAFMLDPRGHSRRTRALTVFIALGLGVFAFLSIHDQLNQTQADRQNGSLGVRFNVEKVTREVWRTSPITGVGLKYYNTGDFGRFAVAANNDVDNELAESGVIGLVGFVALQSLTIGAAVRRRRDGKLVAAAAGVVLAHLLHGMVDIYWSAGVVTLPFLILGMALATGSEFGSRAADSASERRAPAASS